jgi:ATP adenylyltransferase/5',5'''-P-1,P-4-tetraphosphate phosphorylase II
MDTMAMRKLVLAGGVAGLLAGCVGMWPPDMIARDDPAVKYIVIFKNHGEKAGTSLVHPHSQLVATPIPPVLLRRKYEVATG